VWDAGIPLLLGLVPAVPRRASAPDAGSSRPEPRDPRSDDPRSTSPDSSAALRTVARRAFDLADRLGFDRSRLGELAVPTPTCGLAGATPAWARRAMALSRELGKAFVDPPESW
jgi:hypothetical protein